MGTMRKAEPKLYVLVPGAGVIERVRFQNVLSLVIVDLAGGNVNYHPDAQEADFFVVPVVAYPPIPGHVYDVDLGLSISGPPGYAIAVIQEGEEIEPPAVTLRPADIVRAEAARAAKPKGTTMTKKQRRAAAKKAAKTRKANQAKAESAAKSKVKTKTTVKRSSPKGKKKPKKPRTAKQKAADRKRSKAMKGTKPKFGN